MRWAVDVTGIDIEEDLHRELNKGANKPPSSIRRDTWQAADDWRPVQPSSSDELGQVLVLDRRELLDAQKERELESQEAFSAFSKHPSIVATVLRQGSLGGIISGSPAAVGTSSVDHGGNHSLNQSSSMASGDLTVDPPSGREVRVFSTFLNSQGKRIPTLLTMPLPTYRGVDVVLTFLQQTVAASEQLSQLYSTNPRLYKLFIADEFTGEEEMAVQLDLSAQNFSCYVVNPLPAAKLFLFPQRSALLPTTPHDINLCVHVRPIDGQAKAVQRQCVVPGDMLAEQLEVSISFRLPANAIVQGSLRIMYGPLELNINEYYNFGVGCGQPNCPIAERTILSLYRFGVKEVVVNGKAVEEAPTEILRDLTEDIEIDMDVDEAISFQQFEVICINKYGARQQRLLCVDGEHLYTVRPNSSEAMPKTTERMIKDIVDVRVFAEKPKYMEIAYTKASHFAEDHFECTTTYNCALLDEKIRIIRRELRKREAEEEEKTRNETMVQRLVSGFRNRLFGS